MEVKLLINGVDFSECLVEPSERTVDTWVITKKLYDYDEMECVLDFGRHIPPEFFKLSEFWIVEKHPIEYSSFRGQWDVNEKYNLGDIVIYLDNYYRLDSPQFTGVPAVDWTGLVEGKDFYESNQHSYSKFLFKSGASPNTMYRPRRLFGGIGLIVGNANNSRALYPLARVRCFGYAWRTTNSVMFADPQSNFWNYQTDTQILMHTDTRYKIIINENDRTGPDMYNEAGSAPAILDWFDYRTINRLGYQRYGIEITDNSPGNMSEIAAATKSALQRGFSAIGRNEIEAAGNHYLRGTETQTIYAAMRPINRILNSLAIWSGAVWYVSGYKELNYFRPSDVPEFRIGKGAWRNDTAEEDRQKGSSRQVNIEHLSNASILMNAALWVPNEEPRYLPLPAGETIYSFDQLGGLLLSSILSNDPATKIYRIKVGSDGLAYGQNQPLTILPGLERTHLPQHAGELARTPRRPILGDDGYTEGLYDDEPFDTIWYDDDLKRITVPKSFSFVEDEYLLMTPGTLVENTAQFNQISLFHDPNIRDHNGLFIRPIYANDALTPWDALRKVSEILTEGSDLDVVDFYSYNDEWADMLGRIVIFDSPYLNIRDGIGDTRGNFRDSQNRPITNWGQLRIDLNRKFRTPPVGIQGYTDGLPLNVEIEMVSERPVPWQLSADPDADEFYPDVDGGVVRAPGSMRVEYPRLRNFLGNVVQSHYDAIILEPPVLRTGDYRIKYVVDPAEIGDSGLVEDTPVNITVSYDTLIEMKNEVVAYLRELRTKWIGQSSLNDRVFYGISSNNLPADIERAFEREESTGGLREAYQDAVGFQGGQPRIDSYIARQGPELQQAINNVIRIHTGLHNQDVQNEWLISGLGEPRRYYCRELKITGLGAAVQKYEATLYREPPRAQEALALASQDLSRLNLQSNPNLDSLLE